LACVGVEAEEGSNTVEVSGEHEDGVTNENWPGVYVAAEGDRPDGVAAGDGPEGEEGFDGLGRLGEVVVKDVCECGGDDGEEKGVERGAGLEVEGACGLVEAVTGAGAAEREMTVSAEGANQLPGVGVSVLGILVAEGFRGVPGLGVEPDEGVGDEPEVLAVRVGDGEPLTDEAAGPAGLTGDWVEGDDVLAWAEALLPGPLLLEWGE
jgi:hypothetical protein